MKKEVIINTPDVLGGSPRLKGRRLDVAHVIWGITDYDNSNLASYKEDFQVTNDEIRHAILYCKDEICELQEVVQSCNGCSKKFRNDFDSFEEYLEYFGDVRRIEIDKQQFDIIRDKTILLGGLENHKKDFLGNDIWKKAKILYKELKETLDLPKSYEEIIEEL